MTKYQIPKDLCARIEAIIAEAENIRSTLEPRLADMCWQANNASAEWQESEQADAVGSWLDDLGTLREALQDLGEARFNRKPEEVG